MLKQSRSADEGRASGSRHPRTTAASDPAVMQAAATGSARPNCDGTYVLVTNQSETTVAVKTPAAIGTTEDRNHFEMNAARLIGAITSRTRPHCVPSSLRLPCGSF